jgi:hypothetical protein
MTPNELFQADGFGALLEQQYTLGGNVAGVGIPKPKGFVNRVDNCPAWPLHGFSCRASIDEIA